MRTFAHHDAAGNIVAVIGVEAPEGIEVMLQPDPGVLVTELEGVEQALDPENIDAAREFFGQRKVTVHPAQPGTLVPRD